MTRLLVVGLLISAVVLLTIISLIRTRRLQERFALVWIVAAIGVVVFGLSNSALRGLARLSGIAYPPSALFLLASIFVIAVLLQAAVMISRLAAETQNLAQHVALLDARVRELEGTPTADDNDATLTGTGRVSLPG